MIVVDSSIALQWILSEPEADQAERLLGRSDLAAPDILIIEVANVLAKKIRAQNMTAAQANIGVQLVREAIPDMTHSVDLVLHALRLSAELSHPVYDCCFLACAIERDAKLATRDRRFIDRITRAGLADRLWIGTAIS